MGATKGDGRFVRGTDPRRKVLTPEDRWKGWEGLVRTARRRDARGRQAQYVLDRLTAGFAARLRHERAERAARWTFRRPPTNDVRMPGRGRYATV